MGLCLPKDMCGPAEESRCEMGCITSGGQAQCTCNLCALHIEALAKMPMSLQPLPVQHAC